MVCPAKSSLTTAEPPLLDSARHPRAAEFWMPDPDRDGPDQIPQNIVEQDHRIIKKRTQPMLGFKSFVSASATLEGIEVEHDPQGPDDTRTLPICQVRRIGGLTEEDQWLPPINPEVCDRSLDCALPASLCLHSSFQSMNKCHELGAPRSQTLPPIGSAFASPRS